MSETNSSTSSSSSSSTSSTDVVSNKELVTSTSSIDEETKRKSCSHLINQSKSNETSGAATTSCEQTTKVEVVSELSKIKITQAKTAKPPVNKKKQAASNAGINGESSRSHIELQNLAQRNSTNANDRRSFSVIVNGANVKSNAVVNSSQTSNLNKNNAQSTKSLSASKNALNSTVKMNNTAFNTNISKSAIDVNQQQSRQTSTDKS